MNLGEKHKVLPYGSLLIDEPTHDSRMPNFPQNFRIHFN